jgi:hypothetical protein
MPLATEVGAVHHSFTIGAPVRTSFPGGLLEPQLTWFSARTCRHAPETTGAPDVSAIRNEDQLSSIARPAGGEVLIVGPVVVARQRAEPVLGDTYDSVESGVPLERGDEDVPPALERRGDESQPAAIWRPAWLHVDGAIRQQRTCVTGREIQELQLHRISDVPHKRYVASIGRPIRLVCVPRPRRQLVGFPAAHLLAPQRTLHGVDELGAVR